MIRKWVACGLLLALVGFVGFTAGCGDNITTTTTTTVSTTTTTIAGTSSISGTVKFATTSAGVKGNTYISYTGKGSGAIAASSTTGTYEIAGLANGTYYLTVTKEGWATSAETVALTASATQHFSITPSSWEVHFIGSTKLNRILMQSNGNRRNYFIVGDSGKAYGLPVTATSPMGIDWSGVKTIATGSTTDNYVLTGYYTSAESFGAITDLGLGYLVTIETWDDWDNIDAVKNNYFSHPSHDCGLTNITGNGNWVLYNGGTIWYVVAAGILNYSTGSGWNTVGGGSGLTLRDQSRSEGDSKLYMCGANGKLAVTTATTESDPASNSVVEITGFPTTEQLNGISTAGNYYGALTASHYNFIVTEQGNIYVTTTPATGSSWTTDPSSSASGTNGLSGIPYALNAVMDTDFGTYVVGDNGLLMIHSN